MCGVLGIAGEDVSDAAMREALRVLKHRGPDADGIWVDEQGGIALAHVRLAIVDLSPAGAQPMVSSTGRYVITYNGELYNSPELRADLQSCSKAPVWRGHSDTETLLAVLEAWGIGAVERLVGMFAFAVWDRQERTLHLVRDRMGEKPLYYGYLDGLFVFASELKALARMPGFRSDIDREAVSQFAQFGYVPAPLSIYRQFRKLQPGCRLDLVPACRIRRELPDPIQYWSIESVARHGLDNPILDERDAIAQLHAVLRSATRSQMSADVPLGAFLSGGIDSSLIVSLMQEQASRQVRTFTVGFGEHAFDESGHAAAVAQHLGTSHTELRVTANDALSVIPALPEIYDEPFADSSQLPTYLVCRAAREHVTVALSGDGGDEVFGGYNRYFWSKKIWNGVGWMPPGLRGALGEALQLVPTNTWDRLLGSKVQRAGDRAHKIADLLRTVENIDGVYERLINHWRPEDEVVALSGPPVAALRSIRALSPKEPEERMMLQDMLTYLPDDILVKVDRASMAVSLETRAPLLDHRLVSLAWRLPLSMKVRNGRGKWALRQVLYKYVPKELIERPKAGFSVPVADWLRRELRDWAQGYLSKANLESSGYFNTALVMRKWEEHLSGRRDWSSLLWTVLMFEAWRERQITSSRLATH